MCSKCGQEKQLTKEFFQPNFAYRGGFERICKTCKSIRTMASHARNPEKHVAAVKKYKHSEKGKARNRSHMAHRRAHGEIKGQSWECYMGQYRVENAGRIRKTSRKYGLKEHYGLTLEQYEILAAAQGNVCAICKQPQINGRPLSVDHNHTTEENRGLLCDTCNFLLGHAKDSILLLSSAIEYLNRYSQ